MASGFAISRSTSPQNRAAKMPPPMAKAVRAQQTASFWITQLAQPGAQLGEAIAAVLEGSGIELFAETVHRAYLVLDRCPVDAHEVLVVAVHSVPPVTRLKRPAPRSAATPVLVLDGTNSPRGVRAQLPAEARVPPQELQGSGGEWLLPAGCRTARVYK
jgi:hypothetical protein